MKRIQKITKILMYIGMGILLFVIATFIVIRLKTRAYISNDTQEIPHTTVAVILGAAILRDGSLSSILKDRVNTAIQLYQEEKVDKILVTGDNGSVAYNEVNPVRTYLLTRGIPEVDIFLDHAGFDTYSSMYRARDIFLADSITIVTQSFHLPRSVFIARTLGINAYGMNADHGRYKLRNYTREIFADVKAVLDLTFKRQPKYLGDVIPVTGEGGNI
jgi:SanA protein